MPIHAWSRVPSGLFHDFHQSWSIRIKDALNSGRLPKGVAALVEQRSGPRESVVLAKAIWDEIVEEDFAFPVGKDLILVSYKTGGERAAYIEPVTVGDALPDMPLFLTNDLHVMVPLEPTYQATWDASPEECASRSKRGCCRNPKRSERPADFRSRRVQRRQSAGSQLLPLRLDRLDTGSWATTIVQAGTYKAE